MNPPLVEEKPDPDALPTDLTPLRDDNNNINTLSDYNKFSRIDMLITSFRTTNNPGNMSVADNWIGLGKRNNPHTAQDVRVDEIIVKKTESYVLYIRHLNRIKERDTKGVYEYFIISIPIQ